MPDIDIQIVDVLAASDAPVMLAPESELLHALNAAGMVDGWIADRTVVAPGSSMDFLDVHAARLLVESVDVLGNDAGELALFLPLSEDSVRRVWFHSPGVQMAAVEIEEDIRFIPQAFIAQKIFRLVSCKSFLRFVVQAILAAKIGYATFCRNACAAEKYHGSSVIDHDPEDGKPFRVAHAVEWILHTYSVLSSGLE